MFRVANNAAYYRFLWNNAKSTGVYQRLEQHSSNTFQVLHQTTGVGYPFGTWMILTAVCNGPVLQIFVNQTKVLQANVTKDLISQGSIGLYTYDDDQVQFREAVVVALHNISSTVSPAVPNLSVAPTPTSTPTLRPTATPTIVPFTPTNTPQPSIASPTPTIVVATSQPQPTLQAGQALFKFIIYFADMSLSHYSRNFNQQVKQSIANRSQLSEQDIFLTGLRAGSVYAT